MRKRDQKKFENMKKAGEISASALQKVLEAVKPGITLKDLDLIAEEEILNLGAKPAFKRVPDYDYTTCINVNEGLVHGIPTNYALKPGDVVSIDLGAFYNGYNSDQCWTVEVETNKEEKFLKTGQEALKKAIEQAHLGNRIGDISHAIQETIEKQGYTVSRELVGHGVGKTLHEAPFVPGFGNKNEGKKLKEGMTIAIEVIYQKGEYPITTAKDGWTVQTADQSLAAVFEHSIGITPNGPLVFTDF
jgi:methionyl aminopeptidase